MFTCSCVVFSVLCMYSEDYGSLLTKFCQSVCMSVTTLVKASLDFTLRKRYIQYCYRIFLVLSSWIFEKAFRSKVMA